VNPDPERLGGLAWTRRGGGRLTGAERRRLLAAIAKGQAENLIGRARLALGRLPTGARDVDVRRFEPPDSRLARDAEEACAEQPESIAEHSYRTWMFGLALAAVDRVELDRELFYCAALLHDYGIAESVPGRDFTLAGAERAIACADGAAAAPKRGETMADAICVHTTPGIRVDRDGPLGCYIQWGAMVDGAGLRIWDIAHANVQEIVSRHPRGSGFKRELTSMMKAEAAAVPGGRFSLLVRCGLPLAVRLAPFDD
jgi:HD domain-containing protein